MIFWYPYCFQIFKDQCQSVPSISVAVLIHGMPYSNKPCGPCIVLVRQVFQLLQVGMISWPGLSSTVYGSDTFEYIKNQRLLKTQFRIWRWTCLFLDQSAYVESLGTNLQSKANNITWRDEGLFLITTQSTHYDFVCMQENYAKTIFYIWPKGL